MTGTKITEFDFYAQDLTDETTPRTHFRQAVADAAARAKATLPQAVNGRIEKATQIVLAGDVEMLADGRAVVGSQSDAARRYVVGDACECADSARPELEGWCKHAIAVAMLKRAAYLMRQQAGAHVGAAPQSLPEAPASANCYVTLAGRNVQLTLRDQDEGRLLQRLEALLTRFPADEKPQETPEGWCPIHHTQMKFQKNARGAWWSHKSAEGWCKGK